MSTGIENKIQRLYALNEELKDLSAEQLELKKQVLDYFKKHGVPAIEIETSLGILTTKIIDSVHVDYDVAALEEKLDQELIDEVLVKDYRIINIKALTKALRDAGVSAKEFKSWIHVTKHIDKERLQHLFSVGDITKAMIKGCYNARITKKISLKMVKKQKE